MTVTLRQESNARASTKNDVITFEEMDNNFIHFLDNGIIVVGDDSTGTTFKLSDTLKVAGTQNVSTTVSGDTLTITGPDLTSYLTSVSQSDVTQHQSALTITESQISNLGSYLTNSPITVVGDDSTGTTFNSSETIKFAGSGGATVAVSGDTVTITAGGGGGGGDTGDVVFQSTTMSSPTNSDLTVEANGTGELYLTGERVNIANQSDITNYWDTTHWKGPNLYYENLDYDGSYRIYPSAVVSNIKAGSSFVADNSNSRVRNNYRVLSYDINGKDLSALSASRTVADWTFMETHNTSTSSDGEFPQAMANASFLYNYNYSGRDSVFGGNQYGFVTGWEFDYDTGDFYDGGANFTGFYLDYVEAYGSGNLIDDDYSANLISHDGSVRFASSDLARVRGYQESIQRTTHSSGGTLTLDLDYNRPMLKKVTLTSNVTGFDFSNTDLGSSRAHSVTLILCQDGTGGRTVSFTDAGSNPDFLFCGGNKAIDTTANSITVVHLMSLSDAQGNNKWYWNVAPAYTA